MFIFFFKQLWRASLTAANFPAKRYIVAIKSSTNIFIIINRRTGRSVAGRYSPARTSPLATRVGGRVVQAIAAAPSPTAQEPR